MQVNIFKWVICIKSKAIWKSIIFIDQAPFRCCQFLLNSYNKHLKGVFREIKKRLSGSLHKDKSALIRTHCSFFWAGYICGMKEGNYNSALYNAEINSDEQWTVCVWTELDCWCLHSDWAQKRSQRSQIWAIQETMATVTV